MANYSKLDKLLHQLYLGNYFISKSAFELEKIIFGDKAKKLHIDEQIIVTGLARSGTTAVMKKIFDTGEYASLQYSNMPFILSPNFWKRSSNIEAHARAHNDGIIIDGNSPEEFDEFFWKVFLNDNYILENGLKPHELDAIILDEYVNYIKLICLSKGKTKFISKNNNSILRIGSLQKIPNLKTIILFREPLSHASSLMKLDHKFSSDQKKDRFALDYFDYLGHHEFGLHHKPFLLTQEFNLNKEQYSRDTLNYWLAVWLNYHSYLLNSLNKSFLIIAFEDVIESPEKVYDYISKNTTSKVNFGEVKKHIPNEYSYSEHDPLLINKCNSIYKELLMHRAY